MILSVLRRSIIELQEWSKDFKKLNDKKRLARLNLTPLADRHLRGDVIETYRIITGRE